MGRAKARPSLSYRLNCVYMPIMATMNAEMYDALRAAGAPEDKARAAAIAISEESLATKSDIVRLGREFSIVKWTLALVIATTVIPLIRDFL